MAQHEDQRVLQPAKRGRRRSHYVAALDGLRAVAVLAVIFYHMKMSWAPGGLMGVTVFFVISGYLINGLLVAEHESTGTISLSQFWLRRARRILPAVLLAIAGTLVLCALLNPTLFNKARADLVPSLFFYNNWWQIFRDVSYFEAAAAPSPFTHFWSLAIEEQFYIVWPILLLFLFKRKVPKAGIIAVVGVLAVASGVEMALLYDPMTDPSRVYYGTDTRAVSLLIGALLALIWPSTIFGHRRAQSKNAGGKLAFNIVGVVALLGIIAVIVFSNSYTSFPYHGGIVLVSLLSAALIAVLVVPGTWVALLLQTQPFVWIGKRSYSMYLWHYPIILATANMATTMEIPWWVRLAQLVLIFAVSDLSYRFVENPIRSGALGRWWRARRAAVSSKKVVQASKPIYVNSSEKGGEPASGDASVRGDESARGIASAAGLQKFAARATVAVCAALACGSAVALAVVPDSPSATAVPQAQQEQLQAAASSSAGSGVESTASLSAASVSSEASASVSESSSSSTASSEKSASTTSKSKKSSSKSASSSSGSTSKKSTKSASASSKKSSSASSSKKSSSSSKKSSSSASKSKKSSSKSAEKSAAAPSYQEQLASGQITCTQLVITAVQDKAAGLTKKQRAKAKRAMRGFVARTAATVREQVDEAFRQAEKQRRQEAYDDLFYTVHLNKAGAVIYDPVLIGDSVAAGSENEFYKTFPNGHCDALVNRNIWESPYGYYCDNGQAGTYVVFCLGTNNAVTDEQMDDLLSVVPARKKVILVNIRCPRDWEAQTNRAIARAPERHSNIVAIVDWHGASAGHDEYFYEDGIHLNEAGAKAYVALIQQAIQDSVK